MDILPQILDLMRNAWNQCLGQNQVEQQFHIQLCFLFGNYMPLPNEMPKGRGWSLVTVIDQGKTNQHGRLEYEAALRHRDYQSYLIDALATYFFRRWYYSGESFPYFWTSRHWYHIEILKRDNGHLSEPLSNSTAASWTRRLCSEVVIKSSKVTHAGQVSQQYHG